LASRTVVSLSGRTLGLMVNEG